MCRHELAPESDAEQQGVRILLDPDMRRFLSIPLSSSVKNSQILIIKFVQSINPTVCFIHT